MNQLSSAERASVIKCLLEGCSIRSTVRMTGIAKKTVMRLQYEIGAACAKFHDTAVRSLNSKRVQCDEIWSFVYAKEKNVPEAKREHWGYGTVWTWTAIDADSKLVIAWYVGDRTLRSAIPFMDDVRSRLATRVQLTTDGHRPYLQATERAFNYQVDFAILEKLYGPDPLRPGAEARYSPARLKAINIIPICGYPERKHISTSFAERNNLTMRMQMRRFTRLTNGFSKKVENHMSALALHFVHYNFCRIHQTLRVTPAMEAGLTDHVWTIEELVGLLSKSYGA